MNVLATGGSVLERDRLVGQITDGLRISTSAASAILDELITQDLITTPAEDPNHLALTKAGDRLFQRLRSSIDDITERVFGNLARERSGRSPPRAVDHHRAS